MKILILIFAIIVFCSSCAPKRTNINGCAFVDGILIDTTTTEWIKDTTGLDFILDTTLQREYIDVQEDSSALSVNSKDVFSAEVAFKIAEPLLNSAYGKDNITSQKPFRIKLINNVWVIAGTLPKTKGGRVLGGTAYIEIKKSNGQVLKAIHGE